MKIGLFLLLIALSLSACFGSLKREDLLGDWETNNRDSLYFSSDTFELFQDINYSHGLGTCDVIQWHVTKKEFRLQTVYLCSEPGRVRYNAIPEKLLIKRGIGKTFLKIKWQGKTIDQFRVVDYAEKRVERYPYDIKILKVKRIKE